jgi:Tol biopolymer transport system component
LPSPQGDKIAFMHKGFLTVLDLQQNKTYQISQPDSGAVDQTWSGEWSPDGRYLVYAIRVARIQGDQATVDRYPNLYISDLLQNEYVQISSDSNIETSPRWSPDGEWIAFLSDRDNAQNPAGEFVGSLDIYLLATDCLRQLSSCQGQGMRRMTRQGNIAPGQFSWSPQKDALVYTAQIDSVNRDIYLVALDGRITNLTNTPDRDESSVRWAPDGRQISYTATQASETRLFIRSLDHQTAAEIAIPSGWTPDIPICNPQGSELYFSAQQKEKNEVALFRYQQQNQQVDEILPLEKSSRFSSWLTIFPNLENGLVLRISPQGENLNLRSSPSSAGASLKKLKAFEKIEVLDPPLQSGGQSWLRVKSGNLSGWIKLNFSWLLTDESQK